MKWFYQHLRATPNKALALQRAMRDLRQAYPHPYYWAPFVLVGKPFPIYAAYLKHSLGGLYFLACFSTLLLLKDETPRGCLSQDLRQLANWKDRRRWYSGVKGPGGSNRVDGRAVAQSHLIRGKDRF